MKNMKKILFTIAFLISLTGLGQSGLPENAIPPIKTSMLDASVTSQLGGLGWTGGSYNASTGIVTFTSDDGLGFVTGDLRGATGATGSATPDVKLGFLHFDKYDDRFILDLAAQTITLTSFTSSILRSDDLKLQTPTTTQVLDFSTFLTLNTIVYLIWDKTTGLFSLDSSVATFTNSADKYFITSFRRYTSQDDINLSFNQHAFQVRGTAQEYITKWTILGDSHTVGGLWINEAYKLHGKIHETLPLGVSGSTVADILANSFYDRRTSITADTDLLTIFGGTNDFEQTATVGAVTDGGAYTLTTTIGSLQTIIEYAYSVNPSIKILLITPVHHFNNNVGGVQYDVSAYTNAFKDVGSYYNIPVLDLNEKMGINKYNYAEWMNTAETKPIHFNDYGREKVGRLVAEFIKGNF